MRCWHRNSSQNIEKKQTPVTAFSMPNGAKGKVKNENRQQSVST